MQLPKLNLFSDSELINKLNVLRKKENESIADIVLHLFEVDSRKIYRDIGYSSLFTYCTNGLKYSVGAAYRRIEAARSLKENPEIYELLKNGKLSLCTVSEISKVIKPENKIELLTEVQDKAKSEVQKIAARFGAPIAPKRERITPHVVKEDSLVLFNQSLEESKEKKLTFTVAVEVDEEFMKLLDEAKKHMGPIPVAEVFRKTLKTYLSKKESKPTAKPIKKSSNSRYIPKAIRREVSNRDNNCCTFVSPDGKRCSEKMKLQVDHIRPHALGGDSSADNLRLLCPSHNLLMAERVFGRNKIENHFHGGSKI